MKKFTKFLILGCALLTQSESSWASLADQCKTFTADDVKLDNGFITFRKATEFGNHKLNWYGHFGNYSQPTKLTAIQFKGLTNDGISCRFDISLQVGSAPIKTTEVFARITGIKPAIGPVTLEAADVEKFLKDAQSSHSGKQKIGNLEWTTLSGNVLRMPVPAFKPVASASIDENFGSIIEWFPGGELANTYTVKFKDGTQAQLKLSSRGVSIPQMEELLK
jgi:hypothetical protein